MTGRLVALLIAAFLAGCGPSGPPAPPAPQGRDAAALSPAEMRTILEGLQSDRPGVQYASLEALSRFPSVAQANRKDIERLEREGKDERVRRKAAELLASMGK